MRPLDRRTVRSMRARMTAGFVIVLAPCLLIVSALLPNLANRATELRDQELAGRIVQRVNQAMARPDWRVRLAEIMATHVPNESHVALLIVDRNQHLVWRSPGPGPAWPRVVGHLERHAVRRARALAEANAAGRAAAPEKREDRASIGPAEPKHEGHSVLTEGPAAAEVAGSRPAGGGEPDDGWHTIGERAVGLESRPMILHILQSRSALAQGQRLQRLELLLLSLCTVLVVAGGAWVLVGRTLSPIRRLAVQASAASVELRHAGDRQVANLRVRLRAPSQDAEVVELVETLNGLLARLAETAAVKGRFYAAASHELRTPLQALSGHLEVALSRERTAEEYETVLHEAHRQTARLTSLVRDLLLLHQLDSPAARPQEPVDLAEVCDGAPGQLAPLIDARGLRLSADLPPGTEILAIPTHAEILVRNLVENAVKYASSSGQVTLRLTSTGGQARLELFNECPLVPEWNPEKLFEPFYRPDRARSARTGGNGLGLAICRAIAAANGWTVTLRQEPGGVRAVTSFGEPRSGPKARSGEPLLL
jgi:signal transduction histidine kinase